MFDVSISENAVAINPVTIAAARVAVAEKHLAECQAGSGRFVQSATEYLAFAHERAATTPELVAWMREHQHTATRIMAAPMGTREVSIG